MSVDLSIVIPTYNRPSLLRRAVSSALAACPDNGEVIVVDDQSDTAKDALSDVVDHPRLTVVTNASDKGASGARNFGVQIARGAIIIFLDDDDEIVADYPARVLAAAGQSKADFGFAAVTVIDHTRTAGEDTRLQTCTELRHGVVPAQVHLKHKMPGLGYGFWVRRPVYVAIGGLNIAQTVDEDGDLFCRLYGCGHACWFDTTPAFRIHRGYATGAGVSPQLTRSTDPTLEAECRIRTYYQNHAYFPTRSAPRWYLIRRALRFAAFKGVDVPAKAFLANISPLDWRIRAWGFWHLKKLAALRHRSSKAKAR